MRKCGYPKPRSGKTSTASKFPIIEYFWGILLSHFPPGPACFCWCCHFWTVFGNNFHEISPKNGACHISVFDLSPCAGSWLGRTAHCIFVFLFIVFMYFCISVFICVLTCYPLQGVDLAELHPATTPPPCPDWLLWLQTYWDLVRRTCTHNVFFSLT